jgi:hypothetical protein
MLMQLNPPIPLSTPKGPGLAVLVIDYGPDHDLLWTVIIGKGEHAGEIWSYGNPQVRGVENVSLARTPDVAKALAPLAEPWAAIRFDVGDRVRVPPRGVPQVVANVKFNGGQQSVLLKGDGHETWYYSHALVPVLESEPLAAEATRT